MRKHYDFSKAKGNPYAQRLKQQVTIRLDRDTIGYFRGLAEETGIRYQTLINLYLRECASSGKRLSTDWPPAFDRGSQQGTARNGQNHARRATRAERKNYEETK